MENHSITIMISEAAQRAAIIAGEPAGKQQTYAVTQELLASLLSLPWTRVSEDGVASCVVPNSHHFPESDLDLAPGSRIDWGSRYSAYGTIRADAPSVRPADAAAALTHAHGIVASVQTQVDDKRRKRARERAEREASERDQAARWAALPLDRRASVDGLGCCRPSDAGAHYGGPLTVSGYVMYDMRVVQKYEPGAMAEAQREVERLRAERDAERERAAADVRRLERSLLTDYGTPDQIERFDAGVLPVEEFEGVAKKHLFAALADHPTYQSLTEADIEHVEECYEARPKFRTTAYDGPFDASEWATLQRIRAVAPKGAAVEVREHTAYCEMCEAKMTRLSVRVTVEFAGESYRRAYALD